MDTISEGNLGLAMRRLSIIDLCNGWQPFFSNDKQVVAFQNGEIYNYLDLKKQLEALGYYFISNSDTEVLAHGYAAWGMEKLLSQVEGMYAIAILDRKKQALYLARDRFGEKPLFYSYKHGRFAYSSNLLALAALPWVSDGVDPIAINRYLALHYIPGDKTILKDIYRVLPGEYLTIPIHNPIPQRNKYYFLPTEKIVSISQDELGRTIEKAVASRLIADVPVGVFLSGGLDSSIVAAVASKYNQDISTFSMGFTSNEHDESVYADRLAKHIGSSHHEFIFDENSFRTLLPLVAESLDEPIGDQALLPLYWLCREAKNHVTVVLSGEGADEIFGGYSYYRSFCGNLGWRERIKALLGLTATKHEKLKTLIANNVPITPSGFPLLTDQMDRERLMGQRITNIDNWEEVVLESCTKAQNSLQRATAADILTWLPDNLLVKSDRMAMAHSLEGRAPYLDSCLVKAALNLPSSERMDGLVSKKALRQIATQWIPPDILNRPKKGFVLPMRRWLKNWFDEEGISIKEYFSNRTMPGMDTNAIVGLVESDLSQGVQRERLLFALLLFAEWYNKFNYKRQKLRVELLLAGGI